MVKYDAMYRTQTMVAQVCGVVPDIAEGCCDMTGPSPAPYRAVRPRLAALPGCVHQGVRRRHCRSHPLAECLRAERPAQVGCAPFRPGDDRVEGGLDRSGGLRQARV